MRHGYSVINKALTTRLRDRAPGRIQMLTGPRQVGKTTLLLDLAEQWGDSALYLAADSHEAAMPGWWELQWQRLEQMLPRGSALLMLDEVHYLPNWSRLLKAAIDRVYRRKLPVHMVITGSASLPISTGSKETMAGRFERLIMSHWSAKDLAEQFHLSREEAVDCIVRYGGFPGGMNLLQDFPRWRDYIRESIIEPAVGRDLMLLQTIRRPALLRQLFTVCVGHPSEIVALKKIGGQFVEEGTLTTIAHYLQLLKDSYLVVGLQKYSERELRRRASPPKLLPLTNAFLAATHGHTPPSPVDSPARWGVWVENACLAHAWNAGQEVYYWREEPLEVDAVVVGSWGKWAIEVKTGPYTSRDLAGLLEFCRRYPAFRPLVVCDASHTSIARRLGVESVSWKEFLWDGIVGTK